MTAPNRTRWFLVLAFVLVGACGGGDASSPGVDTSSSQSRSLKLPHVASPLADCLGISSAPGGSSSQGIEGTGRRSIYVVSLLHDLTEQRVAVYLHQQQVDGTTSAGMATWRPREHGLKRRGVA